MSSFESPLATGSVSQANGRLRLVLYAAWLILVVWLAAGHVFWRDEVRAYSLALSGSGFAEMARDVHGEGHPLGWYLLLRAAHDLFPVRQVLPMCALAIGMAAMGVVAFAAPFRIPIIAAILFSLFGAFDYVVVARNYGIAALVMFGLAASYIKVRDSLWFGMLLLFLCNTNVPACIIAAAFLLFRMLEILFADSRPSRRQILIFAGNAMLAAVGAILCFLTVYPTFNDEAVSSNFGSLNPAKFLNALADARLGFAHTGFSSFYYFGHQFWPPMDVILLLFCCLGFARRPAALAASLAAFIGMKLFFYFVYQSGYRHEALFLVFLLSLHWMIASGAGFEWNRQSRWASLVEFTGAYVFIALLVLQSVKLLVPVSQRVTDVPYSRSADVGRLLQTPELSNAIVMADPDAMAEPIPYYADNPLWFLRQRRFGEIVRLTRTDRHILSLGDVMADAAELHQRTGRPIVFLTHHRFDASKRDRYVTMHKDETETTPAQVRKLQASMRMIARLGPAGTDETYDVYVYPR